MGKIRIRDDVFTAISIVTLIFMLIGIGIAAFEWNSYAVDPQPSGPVAAAPKKPVLVDESAQPGGDKEGEEADRSEEEGE